MGWLLNLYKTYEANVSQVGKIEKSRWDKEYTLLPIAHTTQNAHIEVDINEDGTFHSADMIGKVNTLIPCTDEAASRAGSKIAPYPLHDKLSYVAGDFVAYGGKIKKEEPFQAYIKQLGNWANSPYATNKVKSIYHYLKKGSLIKDLVDEKVLFLDQNNQLIEKWTSDYEPLQGEKPSIFTAVTGGQESAFVRFNVRIGHTPDVWTDKEMFDSFIAFYNETLGETDLCFVTGEQQPSTERHANKIRHAADKAKLISANDTSGFTYRGRFKTSKEAVGISYDVSQKAHNALKWLIQKQGKTIDDRVFLVWGSDNEQLPAPDDDPYDFFQDDDDEQDVIANTLYLYANEVAKAIDGYKSDLETKADVSIMILDSATTGRMAVLYYRSMEKELYLNRLKAWHAKCYWAHRHRKKDNTRIQFYGAPATKDIAFAAYGPRASDKIVKGLMERMVPCIVDGRTVPTDILRSAFQRASSPQSMETWEWEKTLSIACALLNVKEGLDVSLDYELKDRSYLFGRLLAIADVLERRALGREETRATNAIRYMNSFSKHPERTWKTIQESLQPYQARLGTKATYLSRLIDEVGTMIAIEDFNNQPLTGKYLHGFYSQRQELYKKKADVSEDQENTQSEEQ
ncbi:type I-C CRISPR-associated protein Cas8c/Csd1 [Aureibacillus halotolerans]|uniref:CRISPR-associated Csd1 family protein n=1 Tax=Aureibacillus halotolerans TaxID=1508390 RepID=A0A4R6TTX6_9BACI|nr:type I-C CRISPR-associated protein Cas8c/Csd1 [Aureibacillus halotolerans]TDQ37158.1 CRISPR-associated Csd1 family protein [Aureibacillus halotolerans]